MSLVALSPDLKEIVSLVCESISAPSPRAISTFSSVTFSSLPSYFSVSSAPLSSAAVPSVSSYLSIVRVITLSVRVSFSPASTVPSLLIVNSILVSVVYPKGAVSSTSSYLPAGRPEITVSASPDVNVIVLLSLLFVSSTSDVFSSASVLEAVTFLRSAFSLSDSMRVMLITAPSSSSPFAASFLLTVTVLISSMIVIS